jgi:hypothetical protein
MILEIEANLPSQHGEPDRGGERTCSRRQDRASHELRSAPFASKHRG